MEYLAGTIVALAIVAVAALTGLDRGRSFSPTALIVIAFYYVLFAVIGGSMQTIASELIIALGFLVLAVIGFRRSMWLVAAGIAGHGVFDLFHNLAIRNSGMPVWWPGFCATVDILLGAWLAVGLFRRKDSLDPDYPA